MNDRAVSISEGSFAAAFPFGLILDQDHRVRVAGEALSRREYVRAGDLVDTAFEVVRPRGVDRLALVHSKPNSTLVLRHRASGLRIKGSMVSLETPGRQAFVGSPVLQSVNEVAAQKLTLSDFSPSDATPDLLLAMQANKTALEDAREISKELSTALNSAHAAVRAKERFLAVMSHEIRTPLNGFGAMIDLLRTSELTTEQAEQLVTMDSCAQSLLALVNDILDLSKLEASGVELDLKPHSLPLTLHRVADQFRAEASGKGLLLEVVCEEDTAVHRMFDERRVGQVIANLLGNSVKFTPSGSVRLTQESLGETDIRITIKDTGIGISDAAQRSLFAPFTQGDDSVTREFGGTGLGLAISSELASAMNGSLQLLESSPGGSTFVFTFIAEPTGAGLPLEPPPRSAAAAPAEPEAFRGAHILIVEDHQTNQVIAQRLVEKLGAKATVVSNGRLAVEAVEQTRFDLVLMDLMMPVMAGTDATRRIRALPVEWSGLPIVAFSAGAFERDRKDAVSSGMNGFLEKPIRLHLLREALLEHLSRG